MLTLSQDAKESILSIQVDAALAGHDLGPFEPVEVLTGGYEARCRKCNQSAWVGDSSEEIDAAYTKKVIESLLDLLDEDHQITQKYRNTRVQTN